MQTKKTITAICTLVAVLFIAIAAAGCTSTGAGKTEGVPVFTRLDEVESIALHSASNHTENTITVPEEHFDEMLAWVSAFTLGEAQKDTGGQKLGTDTVSVILTYADGSTDSSDIDFAVRDGVSYSVVRPDFPECWNMFFNSDALDVDGPSTGIAVEAATDDRLAQYTAYNEFNAATDDYGIKLMLTTDRTLRDVRLFGLTWDEGAQGLVKTGDGALYQQGELTAEEPLVVWVSFPGTMPTVGIEFTDADGFAKSFHFMMSGEDGSVFLMKAEPAADYTSPAAVKIAEATDDRLAQYTAYSEFNAATDDYGVKLLLTTDSTLRNVRLFGLTWDEGATALVKTGDGALYQQGELTPENPLVLWVSFPGVLPTVGIEFVDADGTAKSYHIIMSGEDGSILLAEATPAT